MKKKLYINGKCNYNIKNRYIPFLLLLCYVIGIFFSIPFNTVVSATIVNYDFGFEGTVIGSNITGGLPVGSDNIFTSNNVGVYTSNFACQSSPIRSGVRSFGMSENGWLNMSYPKTSYLTHFECYGYLGSYINGGIQLTFYNDTLTRTYPLIQMTYRQHPNNNWNYTNHNGNDVKIDDNLVEKIYFKFGFYINNSLGDCFYYTNDSSIVGEVRNPSYISLNYRIDRIYFGLISSGNYLYIDDMNWTLSNDYNGTTGVGGTEEGCIDTSDFQEFQNGLETESHSYMLVDKPIIEFTTYSPVSLTPEVFEIMVTVYPVGVIYPIGELSDYFLYINGFNLGNPVCYFPYQNTGYYIIYSMQWDISSMGQINNTVLDFELVSLYADGGQYYWELYTSWVENPMTNPFDVIWAQNDSQYLDGVVPDGHGELLSQLQGACWRIFYSAWNPTPLPTPYNNSLNLILEPNGFKKDSNYNGSIYIYELQTGMIEYSVDTVNAYYSLNISYSEDASYQCLPIYSYHDYYGFVANTIEWFGWGYYYVTLEYTNNQTSIISTEFYYANLSDYPPYNPDFYVSIQTSPNPSNVNSPYIVYVYNNNISRYDYWYLCRFTDDSSSYSFAYAIDTYSVTNVNNENFTTFNVYTKDTTGYEIWILFASNDNSLYLNLFEYKHFIRSIFSDAYLFTDLTDNKGYTDTPFNIIYFHSYTLSRVDVKFDGNSINQYTDANQRTSFSHSSGYIGYHDITLELYSNNTWTVLKTVRIQLTKQSGGGDGNDFNIVIPEPYSYFAGIFVIVLMTLSPLAVVGFMSKSTGRDFNFSSIPQILYLIMSIIGFVITILFEWMPVWTVVILFVLIALIILILYFKGKGTTEG